MKKLIKRILIDYYTKMSNTTCKTKQVEITHLTACIIHDLFYEEAR